MTDRVSKLKQEIFQKLVDLGVIDADGNILYQSMQFDVPRNTGLFMPLHVDWQWYDRFSMAHFGELNGDMMADPMQMIKIDAEKHEAFAYTFQNDYVSYFNNASTAKENEYNESLVLEHSVFLTGWLDNIRDHGYELVKTFELDVAPREEAEKAMEDVKKMMDDLSSGKITMEDLLKKLEGNGDE